MHEGDETRAVPEGRSLELQPPRCAGFSSVLGLDLKCVQADKVACMQSRCKLLRSQPVMASPRHKKLHYLRCVQPCGHCNALVTILAVRMTFAVELASARTERGDLARSNLLCCRGVPACYHSCLKLLWCMFCFIVRQPRRNPRSDALEAALTDACSLLDAARSMQQDT